MNNALIIIAIGGAVLIVLEIISFLAVGSSLLASCGRFARWCLTHQESIIIPTGLQIAVANDLIKVGSELIVDDTDEISDGENRFVLPTGATRHPKGSRFVVSGIGRERFIVKPIIEAEQVAASDR